MYPEIYAIFRNCFPTIGITEEIFVKLLDLAHCHLIKYTIDDKLIGFSLINENKIRLLCVEPNYQHNGIGTNLVGVSEEFIRSNGYHEIILGGTDSKLFLGAVIIINANDSSSIPFWEKLGYQAEESCIEMKLDLHDFIFENQEINLWPEGIEFEYYKDDKNDLLKAVALVDEEWVRYFEEDNLIYIAKKDSEIVGFTILDFNDINVLSTKINKVGSIGCVGVIPSAREQGIGLALVAHGSNELKKHKCDIAFIHYTYLEKWYGKLAYRTFMKYWFGKKNL